MSHLHKIERIRHTDKINKYKQMIYQCEQDIKATKRKLKCQERQLRAYKERLNNEDFEKKEKNINFKSQPNGKQNSLDTINEIMTKETIIQSIQSNVDETKGDILQRKLMTRKGDYKDQKDFHQSISYNNTLNCRH